MGLFAQLQTDFSVFCSAQQIASFTPRQGEMHIERCLTQDAHVRRIGVYGTGGVGKTTLLKKKSTIRIFPATEMVLRSEQGWDSELQAEKSTSQFQP